MADMTPPGQGEEEAHSKARLSTDAADLNACLSRAWGLIRAGEESDDTRPLDTAEELLGRALALVSEAQEGRGEVLYAIGSARHKRYRLAGDPKDLDRAIESMREAVERTAPDNPNRWAILSVYGVLLHDRSEVTGDLQLLDEAVAHGRAAVEHAPTDHRVLAYHRINLATMLRTLFIKTGDMSVLREKVDLERRAVRDLGDNDPVRATALSNLSATLRELYLYTGNRDALEEAVEFARKSLASVPGGRAVPPGHLMNLGLALLDRSQLLRAGPDDLEEAIQCGRFAVHQAGPGHNDRAGCVALLGAALDSRYSRHGDRADLDEAIICHREALQLTSRHSADYPSLVAMLAGRLLERFEYGNELQFLDEAIDLSREALAVLPADHADRAGIAGTLAQALAALQERRPDQQDVEQAVTITAERSADPAGPADDTSLLSAHAMALLTQARHAARGQAPDLGRAVAALRAVIAAQSDIPIEQARSMSNLAAVLGERYILQGDQRDLDEGVELLRTADRITPTDHPTRAKTLMNLVLLLFLRFRARQDPSDAADAREAAKAAALITSAPPWIRVQAARHWGAWAAMNSDWAQAVDAFDLALSTLPEVTRRDLDRTDAEFHLTRLHGLACDAAACVLQRGGGDAPTRSLEILEMGRAVLLAQSLEERADLAELRTPASTLMRATAAGPVVIVNVSDVRSDALILTPEGIQILPLPGLSESAVIEFLSQFREAMDIIGAEPARTTRQRLAQRSALEVFAWLWDVIVGPVLRDMGVITRRPEGGEQPRRIWWCPTGLLSFLPLHAAGHYADADGGGGISGVSAMDYAISSYVPTVRALLRAQAQSPSGGQRKLVVALPVHPPEPELPSAAVEAADLKKRFPEVTELQGPQATRENVRRGLADVAWAHFACHAYTAEDSPSDSFLSLYDGPLTITDIRELAIDDADFAFLSACGTAVGGDLLPDEAIHVAAALQLAGFTHVIGTLWPVLDALAPRIARDVYQGLDSDLGQAGRLLHYSLHNLIRSPGRRARPWDWAGYVHIGP